MNLMEPSSSRRGQCNEKSIHGSYIPGTTSQFNEGEGVISATDTYPNAVVSLKFIKNVFNIS